MVTIGNRIGLWTTISRVYPIS